MARLVSFARVPVVLATTIAILAMAYPNFEAELGMFCTANFSGHRDLNLFGRQWWRPADDRVVDLVDEWQIQVDNVAHSLGVILPVETKESLVEGNVNVWTAEELWVLASDHDAAFQTFLFNVIAAARNATLTPPGSGTMFVTFGPDDNANATKSLGGIKNKIQRNEELRRLANQTRRASSATSGVGDPPASSSATQAAIVAKLGDALRGTLVGSTLQLLNALVNTLRSQAEVHGHSIVFDNKFTRSRRVSYVGGYVGVHAKIFFNHVILAEVQLHLRNVMDGTTDCPKEYTHAMYRGIRDGGVNKTAEQQGNRATLLAFVFGLQRPYEMERKRDQGAAVDLVRRTSTVASCEPDAEEVSYFVFEGLLLSYNETAACLDFMTSEDYTAVSVWDAHTRVFVPLPDSDAPDLLDAAYAVSASVAMSLMQPAVPTVASSSPDRPWLVAVYCIPVYVLVLVGMAIGIAKWRRRQEDGGGDGRPAMGMGALRRSAPAQTGSSET